MIKESSSSSNYIFPKSFPYNAIWMITWCYYVPAFHFTFTAFKISYTVDDHYKTLCTQFSVPKEFCLYKKSFANWYFRNNHLQKMHFLYTASLKTPPTTNTPLRASSILNHLHFGVWTIGIALHGSFFIPKEQLHCTCTVRTSFYFWLLERHSHKSKTGERERALEVHVAHASDRVAGS